MTAILTRPSIQPFPVTNGRYEVLPAMRQFARSGFGMPAETGQFRLDRTTPDYLRAKLRVLQEHGDTARQIDAEVEVAGATESLWRVLSILGDEEPEWACVRGREAHFPCLGMSIHGDENGQITEVHTDSLDAPLADLGTAIAEQLKTTDGLSRLCDCIALVLPSDLSIVRAAPSSDSKADRLEILHACFPSSWAPRLKVGRDFTEVHRPVANNEVLLKGHLSLVRAMCFKGPFVRYAWGFHRHGNLDSHPQHRPPKQDLSHLGAEELAAQTWFRVERQTTCPFPQLRRGLFTIRTYIEPLTEVARDPFKARQLAAAIRSMDLKSLRYKGLLDRREALLTYLDQAATMAAAPSAGSA